MKKLAQDICEILDDYHKHHGFQFTGEHILDWVLQFDEKDRQFILEELLHLLKQGIYISREKGRVFLLTSIKELSKRFKFNDVSEFLKHIEFLQLQKDKGNSQEELLHMLGEQLYEVYKIRLKDCGSKSKKYALYIDDIFATGNTAFQDLKKWLLAKSDLGNRNLDEVSKGNKIVIISVFCLHSWPAANIGFRFKMDKSISVDLSDKIEYRCDYKVENHPTRPNEKFNFAYPVNREDKNVMDYLDTLTEGKTYAMTKREYAMREPQRPGKETFFSSPQNRIRFEDILLLKGIEIFKTVQTLQVNQRPMGNINPSFQTLGTGTLFFAWRNISNTTPIVFWWQSKTWRPLFPLVNRG